MYCRKCGIENREDALYCDKCGTPMYDNLPNPESKVKIQHSTPIQTQFNQPQTITNNYETKKTNNSSPLGIVALILSIITTLISFIASSVMLIIIIGILPMIFAIISYNNENKNKLAKASIMLIITSIFIVIIMGMVNKAASITAENTRRATYSDTAKLYISSVRNSVLADELKCGDKSVGYMEDGTYYFEIDSGEYDSDSVRLIGKHKSSWYNADVKGYVKWIRTDHHTEYSILLVDEYSHGIEKVTGVGSDKKYESIAEDDINRDTVSLKTELDYYSGTGFIPENAIKCTSK